MARRIFGHAVHAERRCADGAIALDVVHGTFPSVSENPHASRWRMAARTGILIRYRYYLLGGKSVFGWKSELDKSVKTGSKAPASKMTSYSTENH